MSLDQRVISAAISQCGFDGNCWIESCPSTDKSGVLYVVVNSHGVKLSKLDAALRSLGADDALIYRVMDRAAYEKPGRSALEPWTVLVSTKTGAMANMVRTIDALMFEIHAVTRNEPELSFLERGADSLMFMALRDKLFSRLSVNIAVADLYMFGTPWEIAALVNAARIRENDSKVEAGESAIACESPCSAQRRLHLAHCAHSSAVAYNVPIVIKFKSNFSVTVVRHALEKLVRRHDALRLRFRFENDALVQECIERMVVPFTVARTTPGCLSTLIGSLIQPFCLDKGPLIRAVYLNIVGERPALLLDIHHLCIDGVSLRTIVRDLSALLESRPLSEVKSYWAAVRALNEAAAAYADQHAKYWKRYLAAGVLHQDLPFRRNGVQTVKWSTSEVRQALPAEWVERWKAYAIENGTTLHTFVLSLVHLALEKFCCASESLVGVPYSGRGVPECDDVVGGFVVTLPSRLSVCTETTYRNVLASLHEEALGHARHQHYDFRSIGQAQSALENPGSFTVVYSTQSFGLSANEILECTPIYDPTAKFELFIYLREQEGRFDLLAAYADEILEGEAVASFLAGILHMAEQVLESPDIAVSALRLIPSPEKSEPLVLGLDQVFDRQATVCSRFDSIAEKFPEKIAVQDKTKSLTYKELDDVTTKLAFRLQEAGVRRGDAVGILADRSVSLVMAMLAILKAGGYYVPLDRGMPSARLESLATDAGIAMCLVDESGDAGLPVPTIPIVCDEATAGRSRGLVVGPGSPTDVAYLLFTSGSTGKPKGVLVSHRNILQLVLAENAVPLDENVVALVTGAPTFDAITYEIWGALLNGGSAILIETSTLLDIVAFRRGIERYSPNLIWLTAGLFDKLVAQNAALFAGVSHLIVGGDVVNPESVTRVHVATPEVTVVNGYGPTESTTFSTFHVIPRGIVGPIPIGRCLAMTRAYVYDDAMNELPKGAIGELFLAGEGVAIGYLDKKNQGVTRFVHRARSDGTLERLYKTGDLVRQSESGVYEYRGRKDAQIKISGRRVDPSEIKHVIEQCIGIEAVHVLAVKGDEGVRLNAYLVVDKTFTVGGVISHVNEHLPAYMRPSSYYSVPDLPLNRNGKVDTAALRDTAVELSAVQPAPDVQSWSTPELAIAQVWKEVTGAMPSCRDVPFLSCGGDSIGLVALAFRMEQAFGKRPSIRDLAKYETVRTQALNLIDAAVCEEGDNAEIAGPARNIRAVVTEGQRRLYLLDRLTDGRAPYRVPMLFAIQGEIDADRLGLAWRAVQQRHPALRMRFHFDNGDITATVDDEGGSTLAVKTLDEAATLPECLAADLEHIDVQAGKLTSATLYRLAGTAKFWLAMVFHHIVVDGVSLQYILREIGEVYNGSTLPRATLSSPDRVANGTGARHTENVQYWTKCLQGALTSVQIPTDMPRPAAPTFRGDTLTRVLGREALGQVKAAASRLGITPYLLLFASFSLVISRFSRQRDIVIGTTSHGRDDPMDGAVGMYVRTLPIRLDMRLDQEFAALATALKASVLEAIDHQDIEFEELARLANASQQAWGNPLFNVMFTYSECASRIALTSGVSATLAEYRHYTAKFDLTLIATCLDNEISLELEYATDLYRQEFIATILESYVNVVHQVCADSSLPIGRIALVNEAQARRLIHELNDTERPYAVSDLVHSGFEAMALTRPDAPAVIADGTTVSYSELNGRAESLARSLRQQGAGVGTPVLVSCSRSAAMIVALLAVLKSGAYYVPADLDWPVERYRKVINRVSLKHAITDEAAAENPAWRVLEKELDEVLTLSLDGKESLAGRTRGAGVHTIPTAASAPMPGSTAPIPSSSDLAYVIFTSGSTGEPKGVALSHAPVVNTIDWVNKRYDVKAGDTFLFVNSPCFDLSVYDIFGALSAGACVRIADKSELSDPSRLLSILTHERITVWNSAPATLQRLVPLFEPVGAEDTALRLCLLSGDWIPVSLPREMATVFPHCLVVALGGATEAAIWSNYFEVREDTSKWLSIPYGRPIQNARYYILDDFDAPCAMGMRGRLFIGGDCLAQGYIGDPDRTQERFRPDPYSSKPGARMYDTGDIARWLPDELIQFLGREDHQVKIRGYRIELEEVTSVLREIAEIREAMVMAIPDTTGQKALVAYVVLNDAIEVPAIKAYLALRLPSYMVPPWIAILDHFPSTSNGKFDRTALPGIAEILESQVSRCDAAVDETEEAVKRLWISLLGHDQIALDKGFWEVGGDSLRLVNLFQALNEMAPGALSLPDLLSKSTVRSQAKAVREHLRKTIPMCKADSAMKAPGAPLGMQDEIGRVMALLEDGDSA